MGECAVGSGWFRSSNAYRFLLMWINNDTSILSIMDLLIRWGVSLVIMVFVHHIRWTAMVCHFLMNHYDYYDHNDSSSSLSCWSPSIIIHYSSRSTSTFLFYLPPSSHMFWCKTPSRHQHVQNMVVKGGMAIYLALRMRMQRVQPWQKRRHRLKLGTTERWWETAIKARSLQLERYL